MANSEFVNRLETLFSKVSKETIGQRDVDAEINSLLSESRNEYVDEKLRSALHWSGIYFSPRRWEEWGDIGVVKSFVLSDIQKAKTAMLSRQDRNQGKADV